MDYNTSRNKLVIPEYGRNVQKMVEHCKSMEDRTKRSEFANYIVKIMSNLNAGSGTYGDNNQKLWDHLYIISNFDLDVDTPYAMPEKDKISAKPKPMSYSDNKIRYRTYGRNLAGIIAKACEFEEGEEKDALIRLIAINLKRAYLTWNRSSVEDEHIKADLLKMSKGKLSVPDDFEFPSTNEIIGRKKPVVSNQKNYQSKSNYKQKTSRYDNNRPSRSNTASNRKKTN